MQWSKDINNKWYLANNDILYSDFRENLKPTSDLNIVVSDKKKSVIYIPTHNIHDIYEWYRIFRESYLVSDEFDKYGFAIHGYFDKKRGESIKGWFPNLIEVKASSSNEYKYYNDIAGQHRSSVDYIENFTNISPLFIDGVEVFNEELVLLKNQKYDTLLLYNITQTSVDGLTYTIIINPGDEKFFGVGNTCVVKDLNNNYYNGNIVFISFPGPSLMDIKLDIDVVDAFEIGDLINGAWIETTFANQNGVYQYFENDLTAISEMSDKYKTYGQIVYTYQGITNENKEFYLRRNEDLILTLPYGQYPVINGTCPMNYSEGNAHLIKCEVEYNLDPTEPVYPSVSQPYDYTEEAYRLLFLDTTMADKILAADSKGIGSYKIVDTLLNDIDINMGVQFNPGPTGLEIISFGTTDINGKNNVLDAYNKDKYFMSPVLPNYTFSHGTLGVGFGYSNTWDTVNNVVTITQNVNTTTIYASYAPFISYSEIPSNCFQPGDFVNIKFSFYDDNLGYMTQVLDEQFVVVTSALTNSDVTIEFFPPLDVNFLNETSTYSVAPNNLILTIEAVNTYGTDAGLYITGENTNVKLLIDAFNKTIIGRIYDFTYYDDNLANTYLHLSNIKQSHKYKWENYGSNITVDIVQYAIDHAVELERRIYFKGYNNIQDYISNYLDCCQAGLVDIDLAQMQDVAVVYNNVLNATDRFGIEGSVKIPNFGNVIYFGPDYKEVILDNIKKDTFVALSPFTGYPTNMWVSNVEWDETNNLGKITTLNYIAIPPALDPVTLIPFKDIPTISSWLYDIFNKDINQRNIQNGIGDLYNAVIEDIHVASTADINILVAPASIDTYVLNTYDLILLKDQLNPLENRIYIFNGVGNPLTVYDNINNYSKYNILNGAVNIGNLYFASYIQPPTSISPDTMAIVMASTLITFVPTSASYSNTPYVWYAHKPDTASYAYAMMNYAYDATTANKNSELLKNLTGIVYKEYNEPKISFLKRDKNFKFSNNITDVNAASTANINILVAPASIDTVILNVGDLVLLKDQVTLTENRIYVFNGVGVPLILYGNINSDAYWYVTSGAVNVFNTYQSVFTAPLLPATVITFNLAELSPKMDTRLTLKPVEIAKLGVDNLTQPWKKINMRYDSIEESENLINIEIGINGKRRIRFVDGLTENNIINDIAGQGQYAWILDEDVIVDFAVVGCTQDNGPGTGTLIWYTGTWESGVWVDGIWIQGTWESGTWLNGTFNAFSIIDYYYYVTYDNIQNNVLSIWKTGIWNNGTWNGGIANNITWLNGTFNYGVIVEGTWSTGKFVNGVMNHIIWYDGLFNGGDFETGIWYKGELKQLDPTKPARFGTKANGASGNFADKAIWYEGIFDGGEFWSGINYSGGAYAPSTNHRGSVWYSGEFRSGNFWGGSFVTGVFKNATWHDGVWFGGYYVTLITDLTGQEKRLLIDPAQYDSILGLADDTGYVANTAHRIHTYYQTAFQMTAVVTAPDAFADEAFINIWDEQFNLPYDELVYVNGSGTDTTIDLNISTFTAATASYQAANPSLNLIDGRPFVYAVFKNATWKKGVWMNGYFTDSVWQQGAWVNGYLLNSTFGIDQF